MQLEVTNPDLKRNEKYMEVYEPFRKRLFEIIDIETHMHNGDYRDKRAKMVIQTPYMINDMPLRGYAEVQAAPRYYDLETGLSPIYGSNLYVETSPNKLESVSDLDLTEYPCVNFLDHTSVTTYDVRKEIELVARSGIRYFHIASYDEYMEMWSEMRGALGQPKPTDENYLAYLDANKPMIKKSPEKYVGRIRSVDDMIFAELTCPSFKKQFEKVNHQKFFYPDCIEERWHDGEDDDFQV